MKQKFSSLKKLLFKPAVSAVIFVTIVIIGFGVYAAINSLDDVKSAAAPSNQLTAQKWDYLVDQVKQQASTITNLQAQLATLTGNTDITPLTGNTDIIPQYMYVWLNSVNTVGASLTQTVSDVDYCFVSNVLRTYRNSESDWVTEYCSAYPNAQSDRSIPNGKEISDRKTLWRGTRTLYVWWESNDQLDCGFICVRL